MGAQRPPSLKETVWTKYLSSQGFRLVNQGKVRDTFQGSGLTELIVLATDNISIFNFVLNALIPSKGECLTALTHFWLTSVLRSYPNHLLQSLASPELNRIHDYRECLNELPLERCLVVQNLSGQIFPYEFIFRFHIGGSVYKDYLANGGKFDIYDLPPNLPKWSGLDSPIFTPTDKSDDDDRVSVEKFREATGLEGITTADMLIGAYCVAYEFAKARKILILDTKFEAAKNRLVDEVLTPDSSRFVDEENLNEAIARKKEPDFFDKQIVRGWGMGIETPFGVTGLHKLQGSNPEHIKFVHGLTVPPEIIEKTTERYQAILLRLTGLTLREYQRDAMGIN